jgi:hypothetical protein
VVVNTFGDMPHGTRLPARLRWTTGIRVAYPGRHGVELTAPAGSRLLIDGVEVAVVRGTQPETRQVRLPRGLHFLELHAARRSPGERVALRWSGRLSPTGSARPLRPFTPAETYPAMTSPWGLLNEVEGTDAGAFADEWPRLSTALAAGFVDVPLAPPSPGTIAWRGSLVVKRPGRYRMVFRSDGQPQVTLDGVMLSGAALTRARDAGVRLARGTHPIVVELPTAVPAPTFIRWMWIPPASDGNARAGDGWAIVPPTALRPLHPVEVVAGS